ncbi:NmrA/HSCARG family protein [Daejeonella oryzae]|uniref:NmrA/HSCARG family protein n=1 Tax=Daejeonella oryzae TaxID=1122943 RepID=UPI00040FF0EE|nr:NmrA/HSCARG family protein [Daejeonella oryzae]
MADKKIIAVTGATGAQGGGLARAILNDPNSEFTVRAFTRNRSSEKALELEKLGAEIFEVNIDDPENLKKGLDGCYGAYFVTFFWEHFSPEKELKEAETMANAAKKTGLKHVIWSTLEDTRNWIPLNDDRMPTLMDKYKVPHFDAKGESNKFFTEAGVPTTFLLTSFYWENFIYFGMGPKKGKDGKLGITLPIGNKKLCSMASEDIGKCAYGIFKNSNEYIGKTVGICGEQLTGAEMASEMSDVFGEEIIYNEVTPEAYRQFGFPGADDLGNMFQFNRDFEQVCCESRNIDFSKKLNPELKSFKSWLVEHKKQIPLDQ